MERWMDQPRASCAMAAILAATIAGGACSPECLFIDQSEDGISIGVSTTGEISVLSADYPEGTWVCGGLVLPPRSRGTSPARPMPHRPLPEGDLTLESLAVSTREHEQTAFHAPVRTARVGDVDNGDERKASDIDTDNLIDTSNATAIGISDEKERTTW